MKIKKTVAGGTVEILAADDFNAIPFTVTETALVKAGTPMTLAGKKATDMSAANGILLWDVDPANNPVGSLLVRGIVDQAKAETNSGVTYDAAALKTAVPGIVLRNNIGVNTAGA